MMEKDLARENQFNNRNPSKNPESCQKRLGFFCLARPGVSLLRRGEMSHTPGPWSAAIGGVGTTIWGPNERGPLAGKVAELFTDKDYEYETLEANARLIAAAPELLEACKKADEMLRKQGIVPLFLEQAIAKAEGK